MRLAIGGVLLYRCVVAWQGQSLLAVALYIVEGLSAVFLFAGLGAPFWGAGAAVVECWRAWSEPGDAQVHLLLATLGAALALLGPGALSLDAWIFGWQRIDMPDARRDRSTP